LARHEKNFRVHAEAPLSLNELLALLGSGADDDRTRQEAIACYLSGSDGWREAMKILGGTFADEETRLNERKAD
jgi:hypothetical protein